MVKYRRDFENAVEPMLAMAFKKQDTIAILLHSFECICESTCNSLDVRVLAIVL